MKIADALASIGEAPPAIDPLRRYTAPEVAVIVFRHSPEWFRKHLGGLIRDEGFPRPISNNFRAPWHGEDILAWLRRPKTVAAGAACGNVTDLNAVLRERAAMVAQGGKR